MRSTLLALAVAVLVACREDAPACHAGDHLICTCGGTTHGYQACLADESGYGPCVCDGSTPGLDASCESCAR